MNRRIFFGFFILWNVDTYIQTQLKQKLFEVFFQADSRVNVFVCCHNVKTNQKRIAVESALNLTSSEVASDEVDFRAVSIAIFLGFFFYATLTPTNAT